MAVFKDWRSLSSLLWGFSSHFLLLVSVLARDCSLLSSLMPFLSKFSVSCYTMSDQSLSHCKLWSRSKSLLAKHQSLPARCTRWVSKYQGQYGGCGNVCMSKTGRGCMFISQIFSHLLHQQGESLCDLSLFFTTLNSLCLLLPTPFSPVQAARECSYDKCELRVNSRSNLSTFLSNLNI